MSDFCTTAVGWQTLDPAKRVNYTLGLVLGVDEFLQADTFWLEKHRRHNRLLHGYGTVWGLRLTPPEDLSPTPELRVSAGLAIDPRGREIRVPYTMCARLDQWLTSQRDYLEQHPEYLGGPFAGAPQSTSVCVTLCYRECETDQVPVPGEPCRSQEDAMHPSRILEWFELKLCSGTHSTLSSPPVSSPPSSECFCQPQREEDAVRAFGELLGRIRVESGAAGYLTQEDLAGLVRALKPDPTVPPGPSGGPPLFLDPTDACAFLQTAVRVWVTEIRPALLPWDAPGPWEVKDDCVLLGEMTLPITAAWAVGAGVTIDEHDRPCLLHTRLLQEWLACGPAKP
jgi:hypothetical protein